MTDQMTGAATSPVSLVIPCRPEYVALCRLVAGTMGLRDGLEDEVIEDLKVIVTEACNCFLAVAAGGRQSEVAACSQPEDSSAPEPSVAPGPSAAAEPAAAAGTSPVAGPSAAAATSHPVDCSLRMDFVSRPDAFEITVLYPERRELVSWLEGCDSMSEAGLGLTILRALTDEMVEVDDAEGTALRLTKHLPA